MSAFASARRRLPAPLLALTLLGGAPLVAALTAPVAMADEEVEVELAPPPLKVEVIPPAPSAHHFWVHGYYGWAGGKHVWVPGRYEVSRSGWTWIEARWGVVGRRWHLYPGHWTR